MSRLNLRLLLPLAALFCSTSLIAAPDAAVTVNGKAVPKFKLESMTKSLSRQNQQKEPAELEKIARDEVIARELLQQEAERRGIPASDEFKQGLELARTDLLIAALQIDLLKKNPVKEEEVRGEYDRYKAAAGGNEYHLRHILVEKEEDANGTIAKLKKGAKFEDLVKQSKDTGSAANGGDLGWVPGTSVFGDAPSKLQKGKYSDAPVKTQYGYHILKLEEARQAKIPPYDELKPRIIQGLQRKRVVELQQELRKAATIQ